MHEISVLFVKCGYELPPGQMGHVEHCSLAEREADYFADCILSKLPDVCLVKPEYAAGALGRFKNIGAVAVVLSKARRTPARFHRKRLSGFSSQALPAG